VLNDQIDLKAIKSGYWIISKVDSKLSRTGRHVCPLMVMKRV